ncbi:MAG TPA: hypothetical protein VF765_24585 [Polyangiaceae bacterium]
MRFPLVAALALLACSRSHGAAVDGGPASTGPTAPPSATPAGKTFGAYCVEGGECASTVCFHKRLKTGNPGPERRGADDAVEHDGYCSMSCNSDADCPVPPTNGRCGARGMCKRPE